jgi:hypothetical protein
MKFLSPSDNDGENSEREREETESSSKDTDGMPDLQDPTSEVRRGKA